MHNTKDKYQKIKIRFEKTHKNTTQNEKNQLKRTSCQSSKQISMTVEYIYRCRFLFSIQNVTKDTKTKAHNKRDTIFLCTWLYLKSKMKVSKIWFNRIIHIQWYYTDVLFLTNFVQEIYQDTHSLLLLCLTWYLFSQ